MTSPEADLAPANVTLRPATLADAASIARVHIDARRAAYAHFFPAAYLARLTIDEVAPIWVERLAEPEARSLVAEVDRRVIGQIRFGPAERVEGAGEVLQLHIDPAFWRQSIGSRLMAAAIEGLTEAGYRDAVLNVYRDNERGRRFYESLGWRPDGFEVDAERGGSLILQVRYRRDFPSARIGI
jgi:ribosomal protein S18 acetylase RimI-like enzyme